MMGLEPATFLVGIPAGIQYTIDLVLTDKLH